MISTKPDSTLTFSSMTLNIIAKSHIEFREKVKMIPRRTEYFRQVELQIRYDSLCKEHGKLVREKIYKMMCEKTFTNTYPCFIDIQNIPNISKLDQMVLFMHILGYDAKAIADILFSDQNSVMTIRAKLKRRAPEYFIE